MMPYNIKLFTKLVKLGYSLHTWKYKALFFMHGSHKLGLDEKIGLGVKYGPGNLLVIESWLVDERTCQEKGHAKSSVFH